MNWNYWAGVLFAAAGIFCVLEGIWLVVRYRQIIMPLKRDIAGLTVPPESVTLQHWVLFVLFIANSVVGVSTRLAQGSFTFSFSIYSGALLIVLLTRNFAQFIKHYEERLQAAKRGQDVT